MSDEPARATSRQRVVFCAVAVGLLSAAMFGIGVSSSSGSEAATGPDRPVSSVRVETVFDPALAVVGFLLGVPIGGLAGFLWGRKGLAGAIGFVLVTLLCGFAGLMAAGLLGAETRVIVSGNSVSSHHGAPPIVLLSGALLGTVLGAIAAWYFGRTTSSRDPRPALPA